MRIVEEWLRQYRYPSIEFRTFNGERLACLKNGIRLWKLIHVAKDYGMDAIAVTAHFAGVYTLAQIQMALDYYAAYPHEIDPFLAENEAVTFETLHRQLPQIQRTEVSDLPS